MSNPKIKSGSELDWEMVRKAARGILKAADDAGFKPPEDISGHMVCIGKVGQAMNSIVDALKLRHVNKHELVGSEEMTLFNSVHAYADGYSKIKCSCGWVSNPIKHRDSVTYFKIHVDQEMQDALLEAAKHGKALADVPGS